MLIVYNETKKFGNKAEGRVLESLNQDLALKKHLTSLF